MLLTIFQCTHGSGARELITEHQVHDGKALKYPTDDGIADGTNVLRLHSMDDDDNDDNYVHKGVHASQVVRDHKHNGDHAHQGIHSEHVHAHPSSHMDHINPSLMVFFILEDLKVGKIMPIFFPNGDSSSSPRILPREEADSIPFSLKQLPKLIQLFSFSRGSPQAKAMEDTLTQCEIFEPIKGEIKYCATSLESMLDFTRRVFGLETQFKVVSTNYLKRTKSTLLQNYTVLKVPQEISAPKMVACHTMPYPYAVFYCHSQMSENKVFQVSLGGENGDRVEAVVVCHMDTSQWSRNHVSFRVLGIEPGSSPMCHFFPWDNFVWVPLPTFI
ncbi:BURP domain-containing protein BNM2A-like [Cornus florida]|uniref:BURP domain-containing protein BNM2A-like n=1 Tax=Cornus florida TaxID=4283 RepID=UPI00289FE5C5|nr:BURP domain-containing protein BNM2A-like [Cornus florida]